MIKIISYIIHLKKYTNFKHIGISLVYSKYELSTIKNVYNEAIEKSVNGHKFKLKINFRIVDTLVMNTINNISFIQNINQINEMDNVFDYIHKNLNCYLNLI